MTDKNKTDSTDAEAAKVYEAPKASEGTIACNGTTYNYRASWTVLRKREIPFAEMFSASYTSRKTNSTRPVTFVLNGGPGASSAFLHVGALGPQRVVFTADGRVPLQTTQLIDNKESWLPFTDLVFIDPIGTGLSRTLDDVRFEKLPPKDETEEKLISRGEGNKEYFSIKRDLDSLGEFIQRYLSEHQRWLSPIYLAGESYGGYRVAKLTRILQETFGVGLAGVAMISPALEPNGLDTSDYEAGNWLDVFPSYALAAAYHGKVTGSREKIPSLASLNKIENFALSDLVRVLSVGDYLSEKERSEIFAQYARLSGLDTTYVNRKQGRVAIWEFARKLLEDSGQVVGLYDASVTGQNPFASRDASPYPDPTFAGIDQVFTSGINHHVRSNLKLSTDRRYHLLSEEAFIHWKNDISQHVFHTQVGAVDDLRYGIALSERTKVWVSHGYFDLVTPFFSSRRVSYLMQLTAEQKRRMTFTNYMGGHMFYAWENSRKSFYGDAKKFYA